MPWVNQTDNYDECWCFGYLTYRNCLHWSHRLLIQSISTYENGLDHIWNVRLKYNFAQCHPRNHICITCKGKTIELSLYRCSHAILLSSNCSSAFSWPLSLWVCLCSVYLLPVSYCLCSHRTCPISCTVELYL